MKFERPTKVNVEIGDSVVIGFGSQLAGLVQVTALTENKIVTDYVVPHGVHRDSATFATPYDEAIVLKATGEYLVGEHIPHYEPRHK